MRDTRNAVAAVADQGPRIARLTESDWEMFAAVRLRALTDSLGVNDPQFHQESSFTVAQWRHRLREHAHFVALLGTRPVGMIAAQQENTATVYLYSLWLDPDARGHGLARRLLSAAVDWARNQNARLVTLRVAVDNAVARSVYESLGFAVEGGSGPDTRESEVAMSLSVG